MILDPESTSSYPIVLAFDLTVFHQDSWLAEHTISGCASDDIVVSLARLINALIMTVPTARTQLYCFSTNEVSALHQIIVHKALSSSDSEDVRVCIGALLDIPLALLTTIQPELLENALFRQWTKASRRQLEEHLRDLGLDTTGSVEDLQNRLTNALTSENPTLRRLPKLIALHQAISNLVALPGPGYTTLDHCAKYLLGPCSVPSDDELYRLAKGKDEMLRIRQRARAMAMHRIIRSLRNLLKEHCRGDVSRILVNEAHPLSPAYLQICQDQNLRKLMFMHEVRQSLFVELICSMKRFCLSGNCGSIDWIHLGQHLF